MLMVSSSENFSDNGLLVAVWQRQLAYKINARRYYLRFIFLKTLLSILGITVVILTVAENYNYKPSWNDAISKILLTLPIITTILLKVSSRFDAQKSYKQLKNRAQYLESEIYYYRTRIPPYNGEGSRQLTLSKRMQFLAIEIDSPLHQSALAPWEGEVHVNNNSIGVGSVGGGIVIRLVSHITRSFFLLQQRLWYSLFAAKTEYYSPSQGIKDRFSDLNSAEDYLSVLELEAAIYHSADTGKKVYL